MKQEVQQALQALSNLDLSSCPHEEALNLIRQLGKFGCIKVTLHEGKIIMRGRPNYNGERFSTKSEMSFKPQERNKTYQRASTPNKTMFYATLIPENIEEGELDNMRVIGVFEALPWLRDKTSSGLQKISFGKWLVKKDINLIAVIQHDDYYNASSYTRGLADDFKRFTEQYPELKDETLAVFDFFAKQFAKDVKPGDHHYEYLLSAVFTEMIVNMGFDGVIYPSVRTEGKGFNVAITPEATDNCLELLVAGECSIYKYKATSVIDNDFIVEVPTNETNFTMQPVVEFHAGEAECLRRLGLNSLDELYANVVGE